MSVPLDRLYNYLHNIVNHDILIYRWNPHGSKKLEDLSLLSDHTTQQLTTTPIMVCNDQEPLDYHQYQPADYQKFYNQNLSGINLDVLLHPDFFNEFPPLNFKGLFCHNVHDKILLAHSEMNSNQVALYQQNGFLPVYIWSHSIIARDWFRYAEHDVALAQKTPRKLFLIYNRAWSSTREYRLTFAEMLTKNNGLSKLCRMGFNSIDQENNYQTHVFKNPALHITSTDLEQYFFENNSHSSASADYCTADYQETQVEVVLETLFDDTRWHLTEKTLRPIACGHPFILAATPGSLKYLRSYGFETFEGLIDETYDDIQDPVQRLRAIVFSMEQLVSVGPDTWAQLRDIAVRNKKRFFSVEFQQQVVKEYVDNLNSVIPEMIASRQGQSFKKLHAFACKYFPTAGPELFNDMLDGQYQDVAAWVNRWVINN
jgi:hypothetical protein